MTGRRRWGAGEPGRVRAKVRQNWGQAGGWVEVVREEVGQVEDREG